MKQVCDNCPAVDLGTYEEKSNTFTPTRFRFLASVDWQERNGQMVPVKYSDKALMIRATADPAAPANAKEVRVSESEVTLKWQSVNEEVDPSEFDHKSFGSPAEARELEIQANPTVKELEDR
ncbi:hypothetical protein [Stieleria varia]|nr:hypothetical protein [Stieleria varia]